MIWALLISMLIKLIAGPEQLFTVPKLEKEIKTHISDKEQRKELLSIVKTAKKEIKAFNKETDKAKKKLKKLTNSRDDELDEIKTLFDVNFESRKKFQISMVDKRLDMQTLMTDEEWKNVIENAVSPTEKTERKADKKDDKLDKQVDKLMEDINKSIQKKVTDSLRKEPVVEAFNKFNTALKTHIEEGLSISYENNETAHKRIATREELMEIYTQQNELRNVVYNEFMELYKTILAFTTKNERRAIRGELKKMFK